MSNPKPCRSAVNAPIEIRATRTGAPEIASRVYPDEVDRTTQQMTDQGYTVTSVTRPDH